MICLAKKMLEWAKIALQSENVSSEDEENGNVCSGERNNHLTLCSCASSYLSFEPWSSTCYRLSSETFSPFVMERVRKSKLMWPVCSAASASPAASSYPCPSCAAGWCHLVPSFPPQVLLRCTFQPLLGWLNLECLNDGWLKCVRSCAWTCCWGMVLSACTMGLRSQRRQWLLLPHRESGL